MATPSGTIIETATASAKGDGPITIIVILKIKPDKVARAEELWREQIADIDATEPAGKIRYSLFRRNDEGNEYTVIQE
jgi:quinol monooxygenase YgiN